MIKIIIFIINYNQFLFNYFNKSLNESINFWNDQIIEVLGDFKLLFQIDIMDIYFEYPLPTFIIHNFYTFTYLHVTFS